jgi:hypothetical protein
VGVTRGTTPKSEIWIDLGSCAVAVIGKNPRQIARAEALSVLARNTTIAIGIVALGMELTLGYRTARLFPQKGIPFSILVDNGCCHDVL